MLNQQVTLQGSNSAVWSTPVGSLHDVHLGTTLNVDPPVTHQAGMLDSHIYCQSMSPDFELQSVQAEQPEKERGSAQRVCSEAQSRTCERKWEVSKTNWNILYTFFSVNPHADGP